MNNYNKQNSSGNASHLHEETREFDASKCQLIDISCGLWKDTLRQFLRIMFELLTFNGVCVTNNKQEIRHRNLFDYLLA